MTIMTRTELFGTLTEAARTVYDKREAEAVARTIADKLLGISRLELALEPWAEVETATFGTTLAKVLADLRAGRPVQYIVGSADFCGITLDVEEGVLIPRPETEELVAWIATETRAGARILDIGTGSGAIAVALAAHVVESHVYGIDISAAALRVAARNVVKCGVDVSLFQADALAPLAKWDGEWIAGSFDVVVSNPPYVPQSDIARIHLNVKGFEPREALFVPDDNPLIFYRAVAEKALILLRRGGALYFEIYETASSQVVQLLGSMGFIDIELKQDFNGKDRMIRCKL